MIPSFGHVLYLEFSDRSRTLVAWASDEDALRSSASELSRAVSEEGHWHIARADAVTAYATRMGYNIEVNGLESPPKVFAGQYVQLRSQ